MGDFYFDALSRADALVASHAFDVKAVAHPVAVVHLVTQLEFEITGGGVVQWLSNRSGRYAENTVAALREIGATRCATLVRKMVDLLASAELHDDASRTEAIQRVTTSGHAEWRDLADDLLGWPDDVDRLLRDYVAANAGVFS